jgi:hypothetical protein
VKDQSASGFLDRHLIVGSAGPSGEALGHPAK